MNMKMEDITATHKTSQKELFVVSSHIEMKYYFSLSLVVFIIIIHCVDIIFFLTGFCIAQTFVTPTDERKRHIFSISAEEKHGENEKRQEKNEKRFSFEIFINEFSCRFFFTLILCDRKRVDVNLQKMRY